MALHVSMQFGPSLRFRAGCSCEGLLLGLTLMASEPSTKPLPFVARLRIALVFTLGVSRNSPGFHLLSSTFCVWRNLFIKEKSKGAINLPISVMVNVPWVMVYCVSGMVLVSVRVVP